MENKTEQNIEIPENAFRELRTGEEYEPIMSPKRTYREVSPWSITWGILMTVLFSAAAAYLGLKVGQVQHIDSWHNKYATRYYCSRTSTDTLDDNVLSKCVFSLCG